MTREESDEYFKEILELKNSYYSMGRTITEWIVDYWMSLKFTSREFYTSELICEAELERFAHYALFEIEEKLRENDRKMGTRELSEHYSLWYFHFGYREGKYPRPGIAYETYGLNYLFRWNCVVCMCHLVKKGITEGRNKANYKNLSPTKKKQIDTLCSAGLVGKLFGISPDTVLKYWYLAIKGKLGTYFNDPECEEVLAKRQREYHTRKRKT